jgi:hypothetical protein
MLTQPTTPSRYNILVPNTVCSEAVASFGRRARPSLSQTYLAQPAGRHWCGFQAGCATMMVNTDSWRVPEITAEDEPCGHAQEQEQLQQWQHAVTLLNNLQQCRDGNGSASAPPSQPESMASPNGRECPSNSAASCGTHSNPSSGSNSPTATRSPPANAGSAWVQQFSNFGLQATSDVQTSHQHQQQLLQLLHRWSRSGAMTAAMALHNYAAKVRIVASCQVLCNSMYMQPGAHMLGACVLAGICPHKG